MSRGNNVSLTKARDIFMDILSFGKPWAITFNLATIIAILAVLPTYFLDKAPHFCLFRKYIIPLILRGHCPASGFFTDCRCPACGLTHALSRLLHGDLIGANDYNPLVWFVFPVMIILMLHNAVRHIKSMRK